MKPVWLNHGRQRIRAMSLALSCALWVGPAVRAVTLTNPSLINIPPSGAASPYPSVITVSNLPGEVTRVTVTLSNVSHSFPDDLDILLAGPGGQNVLLMSDAGGSNDLGNVTLTFSDGFRATPSDSGPIAGGNYHPANYGTGDVLPAPAPPAPYGTTLSVFNGTDPNGTWRLFVFDDLSPNAGAIRAGWRLDLSLTNHPPLIISHPQSQTVAPGSTVSFQVVVTGTPPFGYQWLRNGNVIVPFSQGTPTLTLNNVQTAQAGTYAVVVTNAANPSPGVVSSNAILNVLGPLALVEPPTSQFAEPGSAVTFRVTAAGDPPLGYQWRLNGMLVPGETNSSLSLSNLQAFSGGSFSVVLFNGSEAITTEPALLLVRAATGPEPTDDFTDRPTLFAARGILQGNSLMAHSETGEPVPRYGGKSVWLEWISPDDGIVTFMTRGSSFDTLLSVFTGNALDELTLLTSDDDQGGFYTSSVQFNAVRGMAYQIDLDGFGVGGVGGEFTLSWGLELTSELIPVLVAPPQGQSLLIGQDAVFSALTGSLLDTFQWLFNGVPIGGATGSVHTVLSAQSRDAGFYSVLVSNQWGRFVQSPPAALEFGSHATDFLSVQYQKTSLNGNRPAAGFISIGLGDTVWHQGNTQQPGPSDVCSASWGPVVQPLHAEDDGVIHVDTLGSAVAARLKAYHDDHGFFEIPFACGAPGNPSIMQFAAVKGMDYTVEAEADEMSGGVTITCKMGTAPPLADDPRHCLVALNGSILLEIPATNWCPVPSCQWRLNGQDIPGATGTNLLVSNFTATQAGAYSVVLSNFVRMTTNTVAYLELAGPFLLGYSLTTNNTSVDFVITASNATAFVLVTTTDLDTPWVPVATNQDPCVTLLFTNANALLESRRFFRTIPWP